MNSRNDKVEDWKWLRIWLDYMNLHYATVSRLANREDTRDKT
jgi:hypothetical protein